ncbi:MAG: DUF4123 domain-containing protein [Polyangiales bacterium]
MSEGDRAAAVVERLRAEGEGLYAVLDAARDDHVLAAISRSGERFRSLYEGWQGDGLADVAPYLVELPSGSAFVDRLVREGWGESWGIFLVTPEDFFSVRRHLRRFLRVVDHDGKRLLFRYYDPRVMRAWLPTCTPDETRAFFGSASAFITEGRRGATFLRFTPGPEGAEVETFPLPDESPEP